MDRLRKRLQQFRVKVRAFIKYHWDNEPEADRFRSLDVLYVLGAVHCKPITKWRRFCWNVYRSMSVFSFLMMVLNAVDEKSARYNLVDVTWHAVVTLVTGLCFVKDAILNQHLESIQTARNFINSKPFGSGASMFQISNDSAYRKKFFQRLQLTVLAFLALMLANHAIVNASISGIDKLFGTPRIVQHSGAPLAGGIHLLFLLTICPIWVNKYCVGTGTICSLLYGFNTEYEIFVRGFGNTLDDVYSDVEEEFPSTMMAAPEWKRFQRDHLYWMYLEQRVNDQVKLHVQFAENLQLLKPVVKNLFGVIYYNAMVFFSPLIYVTMTIGLSGASFLLASGITVQLLECYMWCRIVDALKDTNEKLELKILELITHIPYSKFHRKKYAGMRTTLCIMKTFVRNHEPFSCGGVFPISVEAFTGLLHIGYTVFTFLRDLGKRSVKSNRPLKRNQKH